MDKIMLRQFDRWKLVFTVQPKIARLYEVIEKMHNRQGFFELTRS